jgi:hypothetical protein
MLNGSYFAIPLDREADTVDVLRGCYRPNSDQNTYSPRLVLASPPC